MTKSKKRILTITLATLGVGLIVVPAVVAGTYFGVVRGEQGSTVQAVRVPISHQQITPVSFSKMQSSVEMFVGTSKEFGILTNEFWNRFTPYYGSLAPGSSWSALVISKRIETILSNYQDGLCLKTPKKFLDWIFAADRDASFFGNLAWYMKTIPSPKLPEHVAQAVRAALSSLTTAAKSVWFDGVNVLREMDAMDQIDPLLGWNEFLMFAPNGTVVGPNVFKSGKIG